MIYSRRRVEANKILEQASTLKPKEKSSEKTKQNRRVL
jgi:hypothetical protein